MRQYHNQTRVPVVILLGGVDLWRSTGGRDGHLPTYKVANSLSGNITFGKFNGKRVETQSGGVPFLANRVSVLTDNRRKPKRILGNGIGQNPK